MYQAIVLLPLLGAIIAGLIALVGAARRHPGGEPGVHDRAHETRFGLTARDDHDDHDPHEAAEGSQAAELITSGLLVLSAILSWIAFVTVAAILFTIGIFGIFINRKNVIVILMSIELILLAVNINLVAFSTHLGDIVGQVFALLVLTVAAAEAAIGLAILVVYFRNRGSIAVEDINLMKG